MNQDDNVSRVSRRARPAWRGILQLRLVRLAGVVFTVLVCAMTTLNAEDDSSPRLALGQGTMSGEVSADSAFIQTRLTQGTELNNDGALPGRKGVVRFEWATDERFTNSSFTEYHRAIGEQDFIVRHQLQGLRSDTEYFYRAIYGVSKDDTTQGPTCSFRTLPGGDSQREVKFIVGSCMNYIKFIHGREGNAKGPITATEADKRLGFPAFVAMKERKPAFFIGTGDIVYYDNPFRVAKTVEELRKCWQEQFRFPRMVEFFRDVPAYWSKDDHDFRFNDSDNERTRPPLPATGIGMFREQLPIAPTGDVASPNYRTHRVSKDLQIWLTEGRDHRSPNKSPDGPAKTMWGFEQREWLQSTLLKSDAKWKVMVNPTPMVGPDDGYKKDNHANLKGFRHEADAFFEWVKKHQLEHNLILICGDRHWQYHSIHPSGVHEFACGALNDENARLGVSPGADSGSDPDGEVRQLFTSPEPSGGFLQVDAGESLKMTHFTDDGKLLYTVKLPWTGE
ncbi:MAG: alkaline phosphatase D family protein [Planctomycetota bacterium]